MNLEKYQHLLSTDISDAMDHGYVMDYMIKPLNTPVAPIMGIAYTVKCYQRSNTHMHHAIYGAPKGAVIVAEVDENNYAVAGGNVCAVAQQNGITGFVVDGCVRDVGEINTLGFPVYARGLCPKPGDKKTEGNTQLPISCGGIEVNTGDLIVADDEGIIVVPQNAIEAILESALAKKIKAEATTLDEWRRKHEATVKGIIG